MAKSLFVSSGRRMSRDCVMQFLFVHTKKTFYETVL